ncbi:hypothetical protein BGZ96_001894 [Linnemannia gamsii]|uniref:Uncharacterized protein n=1 Tax=Linnemannia gamsii TaxID=64522 RepID=A0ABQ7JLP3_9FUNG|nr:hypothetical protein BGZ96_001894 [Linnemannia gamsii]
MRSRLTYSPCGSWSCVAVVRGCSESIKYLAWNPVVPMEFVSGCKDESVRVWKISIRDGGVEDARMVWGTDVGQLCTSGLMLKGAIGLSPINRQLLLQRGAFSDSLPTEKEDEEQDKFSMEGIA